VGAHPRRPARKSAARGGAQAHAQRGDHRQPVGEDHGKGGPRGYDAGKKINGRKRHIVVDTLGLLLAVVVHEASIQDRDGAKLVLERFRSWFTRLRPVWADGGYAGKLVGWTRTHLRRTLGIVKRSDGAKGFEVLPRRWVVERTFGWLGRHRRLARDYEMRTDHSEAMIHIAMITLMAKRLTR
jgi:putative transposase